MTTRREVLLGGVAAVSMPFIVGRAQAQTVKVRRDVTALDANDPFFDQYRAAVRAMHELDASDPRSWRSQAEIHAFHCPHGEIGFAPWHRIYLANFEAICAELIGDPTFALPYWNWSANNGRLPAAFLDGGDLDVHAWEDASDLDTPGWGFINTIAANTMRDNFGLLDSPDGGVFQSGQIEAIRRQTDFDLFWRRLEGGPHNTVHVITGVRNASPFGHMLNGLSPLDPCFWLHHCNVDRIWAEWQAAGNDQPALTDIYSGYFVDGTGAVGDFAAQDYVDHAAKGFTYDTIANVPPPLDFEPLAVDAAAQGLTVLGSRKGVVTVIPDIEARLEVEVTELVDQMRSTRLFRSADPFAQRSVGLEGKRILAKITGVRSTPSSETVVAKVFVNCPYLTPSTSYTDPLYAGSFAFFGSRGEHVEHASKDFYIDITDPLRNVAGSSFQPNLVKVQVMSAQLGGDETATFTIEGADIISV